MIVAILLLIVVTLLFGAAAVKGWLRSALSIALGALAILLCAGFVASHYERWKRDSEREQLIAQAKPMILAEVASKAGVPASQLQDIVWYDQQVNLIACGSVSNTRGYTGPEGRRQFFSDGGNTEIETLGKGKAFEERRVWHCTTDADANLKL